MNILNKSYCMNESNNKHNHFKCMSSEFLPDNEIYYHKKASVILSTMLDSMLSKDIDIKRISIFNETIPVYHLANFFFILINTMLTSIDSRKDKNNYHLLWYLVRNIFRVCPTCANIKDNNGYYLIHLLLMNESILSSSILSSSPSSLPSIRSSSKYEINMIISNLLQINSICVVELVPFLITSPEIKCTILHYLLSHSNSYYHFKAAEQILLAFPAVAK